MDRIDLDHVPAPVSEIELRNQINLQRYREHPLRHEIQHRWFNRPLEERQRIEQQFRAFGERKTFDPRKHATPYARRRNRDDFPPSAA